MNTPSPVKPVKPVFAVPTATQVSIKTGVRAGKHEQDIK